MMEQNHAGEIRGRQIHSAGTLSTVPGGDYIAEGRGHVAAAQ